MAAVPLHLVRSQLARDHEIEAGLLPGAEPALEVDHVGVAHLLQGLGGEGRSDPAGAVNHHRDVVLRDLLFDPLLQVPARDVDGPRDHSLLHLILLADVDNNGLLRQLAHVLQLADVDLANPGFDALEELPERGHDLLRIPTPARIHSGQIVVGVLAFSNLATIASATSLVPTAVGSLRSAFMS